MTSYQESDSASRRDESRGGFGCLIPLIASTVILAIAVTLVSWFVLSDEDEENQSDGDEVAVASDEPDVPGEPGQTAGAQDLLEGVSTDNERASSQALLEVVRSGNWQEFGQPEVIDLGSQTRVERKFRRQDEHIKVTIHTYKSESATQTVLEETGPPARAVPFDNKVVVIEPITDGSTTMVGPLADRLRKFRELLDERDDSE
jgi:hypothetical protein